MALLVYKFSDYEHTTEREQYSVLCKQLKTYYENLDEICIFIANYNIYDCELDGIIFKHDAIIAVEFKNFGGTITAVENGYWKTNDDTIVKGDSRKSIYQQAKFNCIAIKEELEDGNILPSKALKDVTSLVVFHQPTTIVNRLSKKTKSWLHICDDSTFLEKVQDITSAHIDLSKEDMIELIGKLSLDDDYLEVKYSNADILHREVISDVKEVESVESNHNAPIVQGLDEECKELHDFIEKVLKLFLKRDDCNILVLHSQDAKGLCETYGIMLSHEYLITVEAEGIGEYCQKLSQFIKHEVCAINPKFVYCEFGESICIEQHQVENTEVIKAQVIPQNEENPTMLTFRKSKTALPDWLDNMIFKEHKAIYAPKDKRYEYNLDLDDEELKVYLGTYFPRSYAEMFCIVDNLMQNQRFIEIIQGKEFINVLDCGSGTGGDVLGLITALARNLPQVNVNVTAIDGNEASLALLKKLLEGIPYRNVHAHLSTKCQTFNTRKDLYKLDNIKSDYHFVLCDKMICELISKKILQDDAYAIVAKMLTRYLHNDGLLIMLDVTTKDKHTNLYFPQLMNKSLNEFVHSNRTIETLLPLSCAYHDGCKESCYMQQTFIVNHSQKSEDKSRVCYRVLCKRSFKKSILYNTNIESAAHVIHPIKFNQNDESAICRLTKDNKIFIDSFNINL